MEWAHLFYFHSHTYFVIKLGQKKKEEEKKETSPCSAEKSFHAQEQNYTNNIGSIPWSQGCQVLFRTVQIGIGTEKGLCVCWTNMHSASTWFCLKAQANISFFLAQGPWTLPLWNLWQVCSALELQALFTFLPASECSWLLLKLHRIRFTSGLTTALFIWKRRKQNQSLCFLPPIDSCISQCHGESRFMQSVGCWSQLVPFCPFHSNF